jgi:DnaK suppressor protein
MDIEQARKRLTDERAEVSDLLSRARVAGQLDRGTEDEQDADIADPAQSLTAQGMDDAITENLENRLAVLDRALERIKDGSYGKSVRSGQPIPDARLEADPAAELTIEEAEASS